MATNNALSNFMEHKFLDQFVSPIAVGDIYVAVPFTGAVVNAEMEVGLALDGTSFDNVVNDTNSLDEAVTAGNPKSLASYTTGDSILSSAVVDAGSFKVVPIFFDRPGLSSTVQNTYQLDFGVLGDGSGSGTEGVGVSLTGYYVYTGVIKDLSNNLVDISTLSNDVRTAITDGTSTDYVITVDLAKPAFYGTLSKSQQINTGIDILIKKNDIKFSME
jgi:hypothetical protein